MEEARLAKGGAATPTDAIGTLAHAAALAPTPATTPLESAGVWTFTSDRDPFADRPSRLWPRRSSRMLL